MSGWFVKNLGDAMLASPLLDDIHCVLAAGLHTAVDPNRYAAFTRHESEGQLHCDLVVYFSPQCSVEAEKLNAEPCIKPLHHDLCLLVGSPVAWRLLFPEPEV